MAVQWHWNEKIGVMIDKYDNDKNVTYTLYQGNCLLIALIENEEEKTYQMGFFFADDKHMKRCLGLVKDYDNMFYENHKYDFIFYDIKKVREYKKMVSIISQGFNTFSITSGVNII